MDKKIREEGGLPNEERPPVDPIARAFEEKTDHEHNEEKLGKRAVPHVQIPRPGLDIEVPPKPVPDTPEKK